MQSGSSLLICLMMLILFSALAIGAVNTVLTELAIAQSAQHRETAFQAAESGIDHALAAREFDTGRPVSTTVTMAAGSSTTVLTQYLGHDIVPDNVFSADLDDIAAYFFLATSTAVLQLDSGMAGLHGIEAIHQQVFYVIAQAPTVESAGLLSRKSLFPGPQVPDSGSLCGSSTCIRYLRNCLASRCVHTNVQFGPIRTVWTNAT